jgi:phosphoribosylamine--glycine ligase
LMCDGQKHRVVSIADKSRSLFGIYRIVEHMESVYRVLLVGGGGREHAIATALNSDERCEVLACASNRNPGIAEIAAAYGECGERSPDDIVTFAQTHDADMAIIGPESALEAGVADALTASGIFTFGPQAASARIETDKAFQREFMQTESIPGCPSFAVFENTDAACEYIESSSTDLAVKPAGLTGGKGVKIIGDQVTPAEAKSYLRSHDYEQIVLEERLRGEEFTVQAFVANGELRATPAIQDHKRAFEGDTGPNTGGMGSYSTASNILPFMTEPEYAQAVDILEATVSALASYTGILYGQFMLTANGPKVIEFNARFGDPEAMNTLPVMKTSLLDIMRAAEANEELPELEFDQQATVCKYGVPKGYPTDPESGVEIPIDTAHDDTATVFYASVDEQEGDILTTPSRSLAIVGTGDTITQAEGDVENALSTFDGTLRVRHDIGTEEAIQQRITHMRNLRS